MKILLRKKLADPQEVEAAPKYFEVIESVLDVKRGDLIIPRYSSLPHYDELDRDVKKAGATLINSYQQHKWIANFEWYQDLKRYTFDTWDMSNIAKAPPDIRYVVKGKTNSKKWQWKNSMFASNREEAVKIGCNLYSDSMIGSQGIIYRRFEPLKIIEEGINGLPFANEYRFFFYRDSLIAGGFYWSIADDPPTGVPEGAKDLAYTVAKIAGQKANFYVLDIAEREGGGWVLVEVNCGTMSGLSMIEPDYFYSSLKGSI